jgi:hypothetical protein
MEETSVVGGVDTGTALVLALFSTVVLAALHLAAPRIRRIPGVPEHATASFAGGLAVSYVFLHLIPEVARGHQELQELFGEAQRPSALVELGIFLVALVGFLVFYSLEKLAERSQASAHAGGARSEGRSARVPEGGSGGAGAFWIHLGSFVVYNAVITYTLPSNYRTGVAFALLFTVAIGLHFVLSDRGLEEHYGDRFDRWTPRVLLAAALLAGWVLAALFAPTRSVTVSLLTAFLAGSILLNVFKEEIPSTRRSSLPWFTAGLALYAVLLGLVTALEGGGEAGGGTGGEALALVAVLLAPA